MRRAFAVALLILSTGPAVSQRSQVQRIAVLSPVVSPWLAIRKGLAARGFVEGQNLLADVRVGTPDQLPALARDLVAAGPNVILAVSSALPFLRAASADIPIVAFGPDPVEQGFAELRAARRERDWRGHLRGSA
jgi:putative tryptophan/tyrosine transport system substrate-binding protein